jgi:hypothetical protein
MNRRLLTLLMAAGVLAASACGATSTSSRAPDTTARSAPAPADEGDAWSADLDELQDEADRVVEELFEADRDLDYRTIETLTSRAISARYRSQELLATIDGLDPRLQVAAAESVSVTSDLEVAAPDEGAVTTTGSVTVTYDESDGSENTYTYTDIVFEQDGDDLLLADWQLETDSLKASSAFLDTSGSEPTTIEDLTVTLEPGYRNPDGEPAFVEYLFTIDNASDLEVSLHDVEMTTPDDETYDPQFGAANVAEPGDTATARIGFEGPSVPVSGGTLTITLEDDNGDQTLVFMDVPAFLDEDGDPEDQRVVELDDVEFSASGRLGDSAETTGKEIIGAEAFRENLLKIAQTENDPSAGTADAWGILDAWTNEFPWLELTDYKTESTPTSVSGFIATGDVEALAFAVLDSSGTCVGGLVIGIDGLPVTFRTVNISDAGTCNAAAVVAEVDLV